MRTLFWNFRIVDANTDEIGTVITEHGKIIDVLFKNKKAIESLKNHITGAHVLLDGEGSQILMPGFIDMHAHFRAPGYEHKECLESASLAAAAGGFTTVICMADTWPVTDTLAQAAAIKKRADLIGLVDLYPALALTKKLEGKTLSEIGKMVAARTAGAAEPYTPPLLSDDGNDVEDTQLFSRALQTAGRLNIPVSCHCDSNGEENATARALRLGMEAGAHVHIAHVSTKAALKQIRQAKTGTRGNPSLDENSGWVSCETTPHHIALTEKDARKTGSAVPAAVTPPLRSNTDRRALIDGLLDGSIDVIATDHAPHSLRDTAKGARGFSGMETAFAVCNKTLVIDNKMPLKRLSALMSHNPATILGMWDRGLIQKGLAADLVVVNQTEKWVFNAEDGKSRGQNNPFSGKQLTGKVLCTMRGNGIAITPFGCL